MAPLALTLWFLTPAAALSTVQEPMVLCTVKWGQGVHLPQRFCSSGKNVRDVESYLSPKSRQKPKPADCRYFALTTALVSKQTW